MMIIERRFSVSLSFSCSGFRPLSQGKAIALNAPAPLLGEDFKAIVGTKSYAYSTDLHKVEPMHHTRAFLFRPPARGHPPLPAAGLFRQRTRLFRRIQTDSDLTCHFGPLTQLDRESLGSRTFPSVYHASLVSTPISIPILAQSIKSLGSDGRKRYERRLLDFLLMVSQILSCPDVKNRSP